jgi:hypothetical protein
MAPSSIYLARQATLRGILSREGNRDVDVDIELGHMVILCYVMFQAGEDKNVKTTDRKSR